jgi:hypothetical protein
VRSIVAGFLLLLAVETTAADKGSAAVATPEEVTRQMMRLTREGNWRDYTKLLHPEALKEFKRMFREIVGSEIGGELGPMFFNTADVAAYDKADAGALFETFMNNLTSKVPQFGEAVKSAQGTVIGSVPEGADVVHVVYRGSAESEGIAMSRVSAVSLRKHDGQWKLLLSGNIEGLAARLEQLAAAAAARE